MKKEKTLREHAIVIENLAFLGLCSLILSEWLSESALFWPLFAVGLGLCAACGKRLPLFRKGIAFCLHCGVEPEH